MTSFLTSVHKLVNCLPLFLLVGEECMHFKCQVLLRRAEIFKLFQHVAISLIGSQSCDLGHLLYLHIIIMSICKAKDKPFIIRPYLNPVFIYLLCPI